MNEFEDALDEICVVNKKRKKNNQMIFSPKF